MNMTVPRRKGFVDRLRRFLLHMLKDDEQLLPLDDSWIQKQLIESNPSGMILVDARQPDMPILYVNQAFEKNTGYSVNEIVGQNCRFMHGNDRDQAQLTVIRDAIRRQESCVVTLRNYRKDGSMFWNELRISPLRNQQGVVTHFIGIQNDVTARKQAEESLERSEMSYRQIFEDNQAIKLLIDPETGHIVDANSAASQFYGYSKEQLRTLQIQDINILPDERIHEEMQKAHTQKRAFFEFQHRLASGEIRDVNVFSSPVSTVRGQFLYSIIVDVTAQRQAELRREQLVHHLRFLNRTMLELVHLPDEESVYTYIGHQLYQLLGEEVIVLVNRNSPDRRKFIIQGIYGIDDTRLGKALNLLGYSPVGAEYATDTWVTPLFKKKKLMKFDGGLVDLARDVVPAVITRRLVKLFNLGAIYLIGLQKDEDFYAGVQLYMRGASKIENPDLIETFVQQASVVIQRLRSEVQLRESEHRYRALFEQSNDAVFVLDLDGRHLYTNWRAVDMLGYEPGEINGLSYRELVIADEQHHSDDVKLRLLNGDIVRPYERTFRHKDGHLIPAEVNVELVRDTNGEPLHIQSIVRDITRRKHMEEQLRSSEARLRAMIEAIPDLIFRNRIDGTYLDYHAPSPEMLFAPPEKFIDRKIADVLPDAIAQEYMQHIRKSVSMGQVVQYDLWMQLNKQNRRFEVRVVPVSKDEVLSIARDVTEIWETQQELEMAHKRLEFSVDAARLAWWEMDVKSGSVMFDDRKVTMLGYDPADFEDITYHNFIELVHPDDYDAMMQAMYALLNGTSDVYATDYRMRAADGSWMWFHDRGQMTTLVDGQQVVRGFVLDITERKWAQERELELVLEKERRQMLTTFIKNAAHEFRTPLATISSSAYLLFRVNDTLRRSEKYEQIQKQIKRITSLVDLLMLMVKLENDDTFNEVPLEVGLLLDSLYHQLASEYGEYPVVHYVKQDDIPAISGDVQYLSDALRQIIDNAFRYTPRDGEIDIKLEANDDFVSITIQDAGSGIDENALPHIFETFWRQDAAHSTSGFGLGLPIAQKIIQRHGGEINIASQVGQGTTVTVTLPVLSSDHTASS